MAVKATIFKVDLQVNDMDRNHYQEYALTLAQHPSETEERLMARLLAFALNADDSLAFGRGISTDDEPDLWCKDLTGVIQLWIEVGQPDEQRIRKACGRARRYPLYVQRSQRGHLVAEESTALERCRNLEVFDIPMKQARRWPAWFHENEMQCFVQMAKCS